MKPDQAFVPVRKIPTQARARRTFELIVKTAAQILAEDGEEKLTTNYIAERGGFSIGTIYQYFPDRDAILLALIDRERESSLRTVKASLAALHPDTLEDSVRQIVRALVATFSAHRRSRAVFLLMILRLAAKRGVPMQVEYVANLIVEAWRDARGADSSEIADSEAFVLTRAVLGVLRAAVIEDSAHLGKPEFEDALVRLILGFMAHGKAA